MSPKPATRPYILLTLAPLVTCCVGFAAIGPGRQTGYLSVTRCRVGFLALGFAYFCGNYWIRKGLKNRYEALPIPERRAVDLDARVRLQKAIKGSKRMLVLYAFGGIVAQLEMTNRANTFRVLLLLGSILWIGFNYYAFRSLKQSLNRLDAKLEQPETGEIA